MEGNFVKCFSSPTEHALLETSQQLLSRFQTARTNIALFHNVYNLNIFFLHRYQCLTGFQKTRWRAFIQRLQRIMCPHGPIGRHHPRYICGAWRRTSGGRFLNHQKHQHYAGQCLTNHGQTFSEVSNGNWATCGIFPRRVAQLTQVGRRHGSTHHSLSDNGTEKFAQFFRYILFNPLTVLPTLNVEMEIHSWKH